ncbi:MAG: hypothetical protein HY673_11300 [Chloroflexi bacterium]|nr:hypothetical protein [Chloroflexota bacterium]
MSSLAHMVVVDASLAVKWVLSEAHDDEDMDTAAGWEDAGTATAAPSFLPAGATNVLHRRIVASQCLIAESSARILRFAQNDRFLWTADEKFFNSVKRQTTRVGLLGSSPPLRFLPAARRG